jgi:membrane-associated phospholipid phosphatase
MFLTTSEMVGGGLAITYGLFESDDEIYETLHGIRMRSSVLSGVSPVVSTMGLGTFSVALFGGFYAFHFITGDGSSLRTANLGMESFLFSGIATQVLKNMFGRERPSMATREGGRWSGMLSYFEHRDFGSKSIASYDAFPSGHTATIFAAAASIADSYPEKWVSYAAYGTATLVGVSRIMESAHWPSDVFVGAIIGIGSTKIVEELPFNRKNSKLKLSFYGGPSGVGLAFDF